MSVQAMFLAIPKWLLDRVSKRACIYDSEESIAIAQSMQRMNCRNVVVWSCIAILFSVLLSGAFYLRTRSLELSILVFMLGAVLGEAVICDLVARVIPNECCWVIVGLGVLLQLGYGGVQGLLHGVMWALVICGLMYGLAHFSDHHKTSLSIGGGDIRLLFSLCIACGAHAMPAVMVGVGAGALFGCIGMCLKRLSRKDTFAFAPFLAVGISVLALI